MSISSFFFLLLLCVSVAAVDHNILHLVKHMAPPSIALQIGPRSVLSSWMERRRSDRRRILDQPLRIGSPSSSGAAAATVIIFPHGEGEAGEKGSTFLVCVLYVRRSHGALFPPLLSSFRGHVLLSWRQKSSAT